MGWFGLLYYLARLFIHVIDSQAVTAAEFPFQLRIFGSNGGLDLAISSLDLLLALLLCLAILGFVLAPLDGFINDTAKFVEIHFLADALCAGLYFYKGLYPTAILFIIYTIMAAVGYRAWKKAADQK